MKKGNLAGFPIKNTHKVQNMRIKNIADNIDFIKTLPIIGKQPGSEKEEKWLRTVVEFEFKNLEEPGVAIEFSYGNGKRKFVFTLLHGGKYQLPRFIGRFLESRHTPIYGYIQNPEKNISGSMTKIATKLGERPRFQMRESFAA